MIHSAIPVAKTKALFSCAVTAQLINCTADLRLCFCIDTIRVLSLRGLIISGRKISTTGNVAESWHL